MDRTKYLPADLPAPGSRQELLRVAVPLVLSSGSLSLMYVVDRIFLTWYSTDALAAALPAGMLHWTLVSLFLGTAGYVNTFVAQYEGSGRPDRVSASLWQGIYLSVAASLALLLALPLAGPLFDLLDQKPVVRAMEVEYFSIACLGTLPFLVQASLACFYSGRGQTRIIMWVNLAAAVTNMLLDYLLIFGAGPIPRLCISGAALSTVLASCVSTVLYVVVLWRDPAARQYKLLAGWRFDRELLARLLRYGLPNGMHLFVDIVCWTLFVYLVALMGEDQLVATNLAFNLNALAFVPMLGFGTAISTLTGQRIGEGRPELAIRTTWTACRMAVAYMAFFAVVYVLLPDLILYPYRIGSDPAEFAALRAHVIVLLRFVAVYSLFDAMAIVFGAAIRGAGDTRFALVFTALASWSLLVVPTWLAYRYSSHALFHSWTACTVFVAVMGLGFMLRFQQGRWMGMRVIEPDDDFPAWVDEADPLPLPETDPLQEPEPVA
jgi:MATE family multidrug resistance protein